MKKYLVLLFILSFNAFSCENSIKSNFEYPQSLRYKIDSIIHYADSDGNICIKRLPEKDSFQIYILHPKKISLMAISSLNKKDAIEGNGSVGPKSVALHYICRKRCNKELKNKLTSHPDVKVFIEDIETMFNKLESPHQKISIKTLNNADLLIEYLRKQ